MEGSRAENGNQIVSIEHSDFQRRSIGRLPSHRTRPIVAVGEKKASDVARIRHRQEETTTRDQGEKISGDNSSQSITETSAWPVTREDQTSLALSHLDVQIRPTWRLDETKSPFQLSPTFLVRRGKVRITPLANLFCRTSRRSPWNVDQRRRFVSEDDPTCHDHRSQNNEDQPSWQRNHAEPIFSSHSNAKRGEVFSRWWIECFFRLVTVSPRMSKEKMIRPWRINFSSQENGKRKWCGHVIKRTCRCYRPGWERRNEGVWAIDNQTEVSLTVGKVL